MLDVVSPSIVQTVDSVSPIKASFIDKDNEEE